MLNITNPWGNVHQNYNEVPHFPLRWGTTKGRKEKKGERGREGRKQGKEGGRERQGGRNVGINVE